MGRLKVLGQFARHHMARERLCTCKAAQPFLHYVTYYSASFTLTGVDKSSDKLGIAVLNLRLLSSLPV